MKHSKGYRWFSKSTRNPSGTSYQQKNHNRVIELQQSAKLEGGHFAIGGGRPEGLETGYNVAPAIITDITPYARVAKEEILAPVLLVLTYHDEEEAIRIANDTELNAAVYSANMVMALAVVRRLDSDNVSVNNGQYLDVAIPFRWRQAVRVRS
uniref:aldehyde dehydrogenase family protein n=1 Tax=Rhizobium sp. RCAM05350 TaxID=2895568 RepID=UPI0020768342|nr:aldehyde dehydrogenase family protein [Rhizobium sp. RCAM05350]